MMRAHGYRSAWRAVMLCVGLVVGAAAAAHQSGNSYLRISDAPAGTSVQIDFSIRDLNAILQLPATGSVTPARLAAIQPQLSQAVQRLLVIQADREPLPLAFVSQSVALHNDGLYLRQVYTAPAFPVAARQAVVRYNFFKGDDSVARAYAKLSIQGIEVSSVFDSDHPRQRFALREYSHLASITLFAREGILHIWRGIDHLLFLLCLVLPGLFLINPDASSRWRSARPGLAFTLRVVTAFTVAHSITLTAAALDWISVPARWIEPAIALSIVIAALLNLKRGGHRRHAWLAFGFGLIHGLGFADGLRELGLSHRHFLETLLAFNLGVELGQLAILVAIGTLVLPLLQRDQARRHTVAWGSALILPLACIWLIERMLV